MSNKTEDLLKKLKALRDNPGTHGEGVAAQAAIDRINKSKSNNSNNGSSKLPPEGFYVYHKYNHEKTPTYHGPYSDPEHANKKLWNLMDNPNHESSFGNVVFHFGKGNFKTVNPSRPTTFDSTAKINPNNNNTSI